MAWSEARALLEYWSTSPPEHELLALFARIYTTWDPEAAKMTHQESLEARWRSGAYMNVKQMFESFGGRVSTDGSGGAPMTGADLPGIGPFPGAH